MAMFIISRLSVPLPGGLQGVFDYFIRDNLGNIRAVITEEVNQASSTCTMETDDATVQQGEEALFGHPVNNEVSGTRIATNLTPWTANTSAQVSKLVSVNGSTVIGPNVLLKVMAGDVVGAHVAYYYDQDPGSSSSGTDGLQALAGALVNSLTIGAAGSLAQHEAAAIGSSLSGLPGTDALPGFFTSQPGSGSNTAAPRAYLNYLFFDEQFRFVGATSGSRRVSTPATPGTLDMGNVKAVQNGYVLVYVSNASAEPVYFDDLSVAHARSPLIEENHYYAFGLKIASISSKAVASTLNPNAVSRGYQGAYSEEMTDLELNYNEFDLRLYDPQIGRWNSVDPYDEFPSPYTGMGNDPVNNVDPTGGFVYKPEIFRSLLAGGSGAVSSSLGATVSGAMSVVGQGLATLAVAGASYFQDIIVAQAGGNGVVHLGSQITGYELYQQGQYFIAGTKTQVPAASGQLRSFDYARLGRFSARWKTGADGNAYFNGYKNEAGDDVNTAIEKYNANLKAEQFWREVNNFFSDPVNQAFLIAAPLQMQSAMFESGSPSAGNPSLVVREVEVAAVREVEVNTVRVAETNAVRAGASFFTKEIASTSTRLGRDGKAAEIIFKDGSKMDITAARVKEWIPNTNPKAPAGTLQKVKFENFLPGSKGFKRTPTQVEINFLNSLF